MSYGSVIHFRYGTEKNEEHNMCNKYFQKWRKNMGNCKKYWDKLTENLRGCISRKTCEIQQLTVSKKKRVEKRFIVRNESIIDIPSMLDIL